jgi:hypothetical protein
LLLDLQYFLSLRCVLGHHLELPQLLVLLYVLLDLNHLEPHLEHLEHQ